MFHYDLARQYNYEYLESILGDMGTISSAIKHFVGFYGHILKAYFALIVD
jgi:hypothetical protein